MSFFFNQFFLNSNNLRNLEKYIRSVKEDDHGKIPMVLCGNKRDLNEHREVLFDIFFPLPPLLSIFFALFYNDLISRNTNLVILLSFFLLFFSPSIFLRNSSFFNNDFLQVSTQEGEELAKKLGMVFFETSAKENENITVKFFYYHFFWFPISQNKFSLKNFRKLSQNSFGNFAKIQNKRNDKKAKQKQKNSFHYCNIQ